MTEFATEFHEKRYKNIKMMQNYPMDKTATYFRLWIYDVLDADNFNIEKPLNLSSKYKKAKKWKSETIKLKCRHPDAICTKS